MLKIDSVEKGLVIDHIKAGRALEIYKYLKLDKLDCSVAIIKNAKGAIYSRLQDWGSERVNFIEKGIETVKITDFKFL